MKAYIEKLESTGDYLPYSFGMSGRINRDVLEERADRSKTGIACTHAVVAFCFKVLEKRRDQGRVDIAEFELRRKFPQLHLSVTQQQAEGVTVGGQGMTAQAPLPDQPLGEELLDKRGEPGHDNHRSARCFAN